MSLNRHKNLFTVLIALFGSSILAACNLSFAEDITPPPGYQPPEYLLEAESAPVLQYPLVSPNPDSGMDIFTEKCAPCHGDRGLGDGPQADALSVPPTAIGAEEISRYAKPADWYEIVTVGNLERFMPPFTSLTDRQRWDVIAYVFTLSLMVTELDAAASLYLQQCAQCHGETALSDGIAAADLTTIAADFSDQEKMANLSAQDIFKAISNGIDPEMPGFRGNIADDEIWALTSFIRTFTFKPPSLAPDVAATESSEAVVAVETDVAENDVPEANETPTDPLVEGTPVSEASTGFGIIQGMLVNGSGEEIDPTLLVSLHAYDHGDNEFDEVLTIDTTVNPNGSYVFKNVDFVNGRLFLITVDYGEATYGSDVVAADPQNPVLDIPLVYYETTSDTSRLEAERLHVFFEVISLELIRVSQLYIVANTGFNAVITNEANEPLIRFRIPEDASNLTFDDGTLGDRFVLIPGGFGDRRGVLPGSNSEILFSYDIPYDRDLNLDISVPIPVNAVIAMLPDIGLRLKSPLLISAGTQESEGFSYQIFTAGFLSAGGVLPIDISGRIRFGETGADGNQQLSIIFGVSALVLSLIILLVWWLRHTGWSFASVFSDDASQSESSLEDDDPERIMDAIIALDDLYTAGRLPEEAYRNRRAALKAKLTRLIE